MRVVFMAFASVDDHSIIMVLGEDDELSWNNTGQDGMQSSKACISECVPVIGPWNAPYSQNRAIVIHETERLLRNVRWDRSKHIGAFLAAKALDQRGYRNNATVIRSGHEEGAKQCRLPSKEGFTTIVAD